MLIAMCGLRQMKRLTSPVTVTVLPVSNEIPEWCAVAISPPIQSSAISTGVSARLIRCGIVRSIGFCSIEDSDEARNVIASGGLSVSVLMQAYTSLAFSSLNVLTPKLGMLLSGNMGLRLALCLRNSLRVKPLLFPVWSDESPMTTTPFHDGWRTSVCT